MKKAVLFITFNRFDTVQKVFEQIAIAKPPRLYISSDAARDDKEGEKELIEEIRSWILSAIDWQCEVKTKFNQENMGCAKGISSAVTWFFEHEEDGIILEDDTVPHQSFFSYCEELLDYYKDDKRVWHIAGDNGLGEIDINDSYFFFPLMLCWGWAGWRDRWMPNFTLNLQDYLPQDVEFVSDKEYLRDYYKNILSIMQSDNPIDSWAYPWSLTHLKNKALCIVPTKNLISNIGFTGVHYQDAYDDPRLNNKTYDAYSDSPELEHPKKIAINKILSEALMALMIPPPQQAQQAQTPVQAEIVQVNLEEQISQSVGLHLEHQISNYLNSNVEQKISAYLDSVFEQRITEHLDKDFDRRVTDHLDKVFNRRLSNYNKSRSKLRSIRKQLYRFLSHITFGKLQEKLKKKYKKNRAIKENLPLTDENKTTKLVEVSQNIVEISSCCEDQKKSGVEYSSKSYAQDGEDIILKAFFEDKPDYKGFYVDIGAHHPERFSNTKIFYDVGWRGINIDATPGSMKIFNVERPNDINLEVGVSDSQGYLEYYTFEESALNSFNKDLSEKYIATGWKIKDIIKIKTNNLNNILSNHIADNQKIDFISMDIEGFELQVLKTFDFSKYAPDYFYIENLSFMDLDFTKLVQDEIYNILKSESYYPVAKTKRTILYKKNPSNKPIDWTDLENYTNNIKLAYNRITGKALNLDYTSTFSEKMQWLRAFDNSILKTKLADKYECREYVQEEIGEKYLVPLLGVYDHFDEIDFNSLPQKFVIKCNHGCGYNLIVKDKDNINMIETEQLITSWLNENYAFKFGEVHYKDIKPKIIIEMYLEELDGHLSDYKYYCFHGKPYYVLYCDCNRETSLLEQSFFDLQWNNLQAHLIGDLLEGSKEIPENFQLMTELAEKLAKDFKHVRIDFYNIKGKIYFGEFTFTSHGGYFDFKPEVWDQRFGDLLTLNNNV